MHPFCSLCLSKCCSSCLQTSADCELRDAKERFQRINEAKILLLDRKQRVPALGNFTWLENRSSKCPVNFVNSAEEIYMLCALKYQ